MKKYILLIIFLMIIMPTNINASVISLTKSETLLDVGYSETLKYNLKEGLNSSNIIWTSSNEKVATVDNGKITALSEGTTIITASINGNKSTCTVVVSKNYIAATGISLNLSKINMLVGDVKNLSATISPENATNKDITWTSSNPKVATIDNGKITAKSLGTTIITASINGKKSTCEVIVADTILLESISVNKSTLTLKENTSQTLIVTYTPENATNKNITWKSSNNNIVIVDEYGKVTALKKGNATITAISKDGGHVSLCKITVESVSKKVTNLTLDKTEIKLMAGESANLKATITPDYAENKNITWSSSNEQIVTVTNGLITAISPGTAQIKAISEDGQKEATCLITVLSPLLEGITFNEEKRILYLNDEIYIRPIPSPSNAIIENPIWESSNPDIVNVEHGLIKALSVGEATITIYNQEKSLSSSIIIEVLNKPKEKLNITIDGYNLNFNENIKNYTLLIGNEEKLNIKTNVNEEQVTINGNNKLKTGSIITITINQETPETYVINIKKKGNYTIFFIFIIIALLILNIFRIMNKNKKKS